MQPRYKGCGGVGTVCACRLCTQYTQTRCLSVPNECDNGTITDDDAPPPSGLARLSGPLGFCLDGQCDDAHSGCCLTCY
jgi:hypothetical protein